MESTLKNGQKTFEILIADDHEMVRTGLKVMLSSKKESISFNLTEAETSEEAIQKGTRQQYDVILMDYHLPDKGGQFATAEILKVFPRTKVLAISTYDELSCIEQMLTAGAKGYLLKNVEPGQLLLAIKKVLVGETYFSSEVASKLLDVGKRIRSDGNRKDRLSGRETEVLKCIAAEMTNEEIAQVLHISKRTVETHRQNLMGKLHAKNMVGLLKAAYQNNLL